MKMLQNLLISARARPKKRRGGKKRGPNLQQFFQFLPNFSVFDFLWQSWLDFTNIAEFVPNPIRRTPILTSSPTSLRQPRSNEARPHKPLDFLPREALVDYCSTEKLTDRHTTMINAPKFSLLNYSPRQQLSNLTSTIDSFSKPVFGGQVVKDGSTKLKMPTRYGSVAQRDRKRLYINSYY